MPSPVCSSPLLLLILLLNCFCSAFPAVDEPPDNGGIPSSPSPSPSALFNLSFDPFRPSDDYRCGAFEQHKDPAMRLLHWAQNALIRALSRPFPHQKLLSDGALLGQLEEWRNSLMERSSQWAHFSFWWLLLAAILLSVPPLFVLLFLLIRCCLCLCRSRRDASDGNGKLHKSDERWDGVRRVLLGALAGALVVANVFCSAVLLLSTQYAQHGLDQLPTRLHYCANDLLVYRGETQEQMRKLLREDFFRLNHSLQLGLDSAGEAVVRRLKQSTGLDSLDQLVQKTNAAGPMRSRLDALQAELPSVLDSRHGLEQRLGRLRQAKEGLRECERTARSGERAALCHRARQALGPLLELGWQDGLDWETERRAEQTALLLPDKIPEALTQIQALQLEAKFEGPMEGMRTLERGIQAVVDSRREDADERIRLLDRTLAGLYERINSAIKTVDMRFVDEQLIDPMMRQREHWRHLVHLGWLGSLVLSGLFAFLALSFLLGLCFGCCGRRPSDFADDDCCVRSTGASFFACSIWLSLALLTLFGLLSALAMLAGATTAHLVCHPMEIPLQRPDMISLLDRLVSLYGLDRPSGLPNSNSLSLGLPDPLFSDQRRPAQLIRQCSRGTTLYAMFGLDQRFKLLAGGGPSDEYNGLEESLRQFLLSGRALDEAIGRTSAPSSTAGAGGGLEFRRQLASVGLRPALEQLGRMDIPDWDEKSLAEFCEQPSRFQRLESVIAELRHLHEADEDASKNGQPIEELVSVLNFLEELRPETVQVCAKLESVCRRLNQFRAELLSLRLALNSTDSLVSNLDRLQFQLRSLDQIRQRLYSAGAEVVQEMGQMVRHYGEHVNNSMVTEVSSCAPLADIARNTRSALCDHALDHLNALWLTLGVGLLLLLPTILLAQTLRPLYRRTRPFYKQPPFSSEFSPNEAAAFATDIYGMSQGYGKMTAATAPQLGQCTQITSPYATANYGYQELGPPAYFGTSRR